MSGRGAKQRAHARAIAAAKLAAQGLTHREIATQLGVKEVAKVKGLIELGQRLSQQQPE